MSFKEKFIKMNFKAILPDFNDFFFAGLMDHPKFLNEFCVMIHFCRVIKKVQIHQSSSQGKQYGRINKLFRVV